MISPAVEDLPSGATNRIAYVVKRYPRYSETFIVNEILAHEADGSEVHIFALRPTLDTHFQSILSRVRAPVRYLPYPVGKARSFWSTLVDSAGQLPRLWSEMEAAAEGSIDDVNQALVLAKAVRELGIGRMHAHFATSATTVARLASRFSGVPYSFTAHAKDIFHESVDPGELREKIASASDVIAISQFNRQFLCDAFPEYAARIQLVYNGLDLEDWPFSMPAERPRSIVAVGRLVEKKGFSHLIDACRMLADRGEEFTCSIIGTGELEHQLRDRISAAQVGELVHLVGPRPHDEVREAIRNAAVVAVPCVHGEDGNRDGLPTIILEAMALGTPVIATPVTGIPEAVEHGDTGLMADEGNPASLADAISVLLNDAAQRCHLAERARQQIEQKFNVHVNAEKLRQVFAARVPAPSPVEQVPCIG